MGQSVASLELEAPTTDDKPRQGSATSFEFGDLANGDLVSSDLANGDLATSDLANGDLASSDLANGDLAISDPAGVKCARSPPHFHSPFNEWSLILTEIASLLENVSDTFDNINSQEVLEEVVDSDEGQTFIDNLLEVYKVYRRIAMSVKLTGELDKSSLHLLTRGEEIERWWRLLSDRVKMVDELSRSLDFPTRYLEEAGATGVTCSLCLLDVETSQVGVRQDMRLAHGGRQYHSGCANFWVNRVHAVLPSLVVL